MQTPVQSRRRWPAFLLFPTLLSAGWLAYQAGLDAARAQGAAAVNGVSRPQYRISTAIDYDLLTLRSTARVTVPVSANDPLADASFFLFANAGGVGGDDARRKNLVVDGVSLGGNPVPWKLNGAVLHVNLPAPQAAAFTLEIKYHGVVPRSAGGGDDMMGAMGADISSLLGMGGNQTEKPKNTDYGLYTYANGILSLGSFWYPQLAVRENGKWADAQPEGLGDVAYAEKSDYEVSFQGLPDNVTVVSPGRENNRVIRANDVREFAVLMSEDFVSRTKLVPIGARNVQVTSYASRKNASKLNQTLDVTEKALQIYSRRFGAYPFDEFKVVEAPMKGGAGGMEYSSVVGIASMLYGDFNKQLGGMMTTLNLPGADDLLKGLEADAGMDAPAAPKNVPQEAPEDGTGANAMSDMVGGILGQQKQMFDSLLEVTIAHEVAHQWWAISVGSDSQRYPWVDESLTNWSSMLYMEDRYGKAKAEEMMDLHLKTSYSMGVMLGGGDAPANLPTSAYTNNLQYGAIIYGKAALFYDKLRELVGDEAYFAALREYYATYRDRLAGPATLHRIVVSKAPAKQARIDALYRRWIEEKHGQEDIGSSSALGGLDLNGMLGNLLGGGIGGEE